MKNPGLAAVLSFFFTGLGLMLVLVGFILYPILLLLNIMDAYKTAEKINRQVT